MYNKVKNSNDPLRALVIIEISAVNHRNYFSLNRIRTYVYYTVLLLLLFIRSLRYGFSNYFEQYITCEKTLILFFSFFPPRRIQNVILI